MRSIISLCFVAEQATARYSEPLEGCFKIIGFREAPNAPTLTAPPDDKVNVIGILATKSSSANGSTVLEFKLRMMGSTPGLNFHWLKAFTAAASRSLNPVD